MATEIPNDNAERAPSFEELPGANTQGATLEEAKENLQEAAAMILEANRELAEKSIAGQTVTREPFIPSS